MCSAMARDAPSFNPFCTMALNSTPCSSITPSEFTNIFPNAKLPPSASSTIFLSPNFLVKYCTNTHLLYPVTSSFSAHILFSLEHATPLYFRIKDNMARFRLIKVIAPNLSCFDLVVLTLNLSYSHSYLVVSAGLLRIFGRNVAELPLVATSRAHQGKGYFEVLFSCIERLLSSLNVEKLVLPAAGDAESIWTMKLGFRKMSEDQTSIVFSLEEGSGSIIQRQSKIDPSLSNDVANTTTITHTPVYNDVHKPPDVDMNKLNDGGKYTQSLKMTKTTTTCPIRRR
ncbi:Increased DNA methylation 1 [Glycine soja]